VSLEQHGDKWRRIDTVVEDAMGAITVKLWNASREVEGLSVGHTLQWTSVTVIHTRQCTEGENWRRIDTVIADANGSITLKVWNASPEAERLGVGHKTVAHNVRVNHFNGLVTLSTTADKCTGGK